jgi:hypothetical protein
MYNAAQVNHFKPMLTPTPLIPTEVYLHKTKPLNLKFVA